MTEQELAGALFNAGVMTRQQIEAAAAERTPYKNFAQVVVEKGWATPAQIATFDPHALPAQNTFSSPSYSHTGANEMFTPVADQTFQPPPLPEPDAFSPFYQQQYSESVSGTTILVLGILSLVFCQLLGPIAWYMGSQAVRAIDAGRANPLERTNASVGRILGIISTLLMLLVGAFFLLGFLAILTENPRTN